MYYEVENILRLFVLTVCGFMFFNNLNRADNNINTLCRIP